MMCGLITPRQFGPTILIPYLYLILLISSSNPLPASPAGEKPALNKVASLSQEVEDGKGKSEPAPAHLGIIEETWPFLVERLMEDA